MIVFLYMIFVILAGLLISLIMPGFADNMNITFYLALTAVFAVSALIILARKHIPLFKTLSVYIAVFLSLFVVCEGVLIYFSADDNPTGKEQAIIVAGSGLFVESRLTAELEERIDMAVEIYADNPSLPIVLSGGTDESRALPQCVAMKSYLEKQIASQGLEMPTVITEDRSSGIVENVKLSLEKCGADSAYIIVSRHNVPQTKLIAGKFSPLSTVVGAEYPLSKYVIYYIREVWFSIATAISVGLY